MLKNNGLVFSFIKGTVIAVIFSLLSVLIFAFLIKIFSISMGAIKPVTTAIKIIAVALGAFISTSESKGAIKGGIAGVIITVICFLIFSILGKSFAFNLTFLWEILLGATVGAVVGVIAVNLKK